jgi:hypothetical protein
VNSIHGDSTKAWSVQSKSFAVIWDHGATPKEGEFVRLQRRGPKTVIHTPDFTPIGTLKYALPSLRGVLFGTVAEGLNEVEITYHGPGTLK